MERTVIWLEKRPAIWLERGGIRISYLEERVELPQVDPMEWWRTYEYRFLI